MDIVLRAIIAFGFVLLLTRIVGRRELGSLEPFDLILLVMIGDLVQQGVTQNDFSVTGMLLAGGTIAEPRSQPDHAGGAPRRRPHARARVARACAVGGARNEREHQLHRARAVERHLTGRAGAATPRELAGE
jgi:hypothetical protein